jgi:cation diffusion facilitator family transporter
MATIPPGGHAHVFLGHDHDQAERRTWWVIALCTAMMLAEIVGGILFGSIAHAGALLLAALAYRFARRYAHDARFAFGTGKLGDLAGFSSAIVLAMIALLIGYEAIMRFFNPVPIHFGAAIPIACLGLAVNVASVWLLSGGGHHHHDHDHDHDHDHGPHDGAKVGHDNNMRAAIVHVMADAAVSVLVIVGLGLAREFGWVWMDPLAGIIGAGVIASWSYGLIRDTGAILLDMTPDAAVQDGIRDRVEEAGDRLTDLHVWRLGPGHLGAIVAVSTKRGVGPEDYRARLAGIRSLSHLTIEVQNA